MADKLKACFSISNPELKACYSVEDKKMDACFKLNVIPDVSNFITDVEGEGVINTTRVGSTVYVTSTTFVFEQGLASDTWVIEHNLNKRPSIIVVDSLDRVQVPDDIYYNSDNQMTVTFLAAFAGKAYLN